MIDRRLCLVVAAILALLSVANASQFHGDYNYTWHRTVTVYSLGNGVFFANETYDPKGGVATARFSDSLNTTGWGVLEVETNSAYSDNDQMYAAGYAEGYVTKARIVEQYWNMMDVFYPGQVVPDQDILDFLNQNEAWQKDQVTKFYKDPFWQHVGYIGRQFDGLVDGTNQDALVTYPRYYFQILNAVGDLIDLTHAVNFSNGFAPGVGRDTKKYGPFDRDVTKWTPMQFKEFVRKSGHCTGFISLTGAYEELLMAHSSWFAYSSMNRIYKHYNFPLSSSSMAAQKISFSSYPGFLESLDDFYIMSSGLVMIQTTNNVFNMSLYDFVVPESLLAWVRVRVANAMSRGGEDWYHYVSKYNSGTYNNQYMIVNTNLFTRGQSLPDHTLWVVEQIPTLVEGADVTGYLRLGYWPSYNVPFFKKVYEMSGYPAVVKTFGNDYSYDLCPRAKIFRRDNTNATDIMSLGAMMRYNNFENDPYAGQDPWGAICSRGDLATDGTASPNGCYDSKITNVMNARKMKSWAINGPTNEQQPTFTWKDSWRKTAHFGQPQTYDFDWYLMQPSWAQ